MRVSRLALGTMTWGRDTDAEEAATKLVAFVDAGGTFVDTADVYNDGESERILGKLLTDLIPRDEVVLATKAVVVWVHAMPDGAPARYDVGVRFDEMDEADQQRLSHVLDD